MSEEIDVKGLLDASRMLREKAGIPIEFDALLDQAFKRAKDAETASEFQLCVSAYCEIMRMGGKPL